MPIIFSKSARSRSSSSCWGTFRNDCACSFTRTAMPRTPYASHGSALPRAMSKEVKYDSVVSTRCPITSRTSHPSEPVEEVHTTSGSARASIPSASRRTTRSRLSFPS